MSNFGTILTDFDGFTKQLFLFSYCRNSSVHDILTEAALDKHYFDFVSIPFPNLVAKEQSSIKHQFSSLQAKYDNTSFSWDPHIYVQIVAKIAFSPTFRHRYQDIPIELFSVIGDRSQKLYPISLLLAMNECKENISKLR